uniref:Vacuolar fusion protein MON1 homolog n=1 Tax=Oncorhynchus tshawytscha TaxID=74940 RepID=A0A8C8HKU2_ONCTS
METERDSVLWESRQSVKEEALCLGAEEETQKEQQPKVEVEEEVCPESRIKDEDVCSETCHGYKVVFLRKTPLVLVGVSQTCQSDRELTRELQYIYYQINYDLGRLLTGSEHLTDNLLRLLDRDLGLLVSTVTCLPLASSTSDLVSSRLPRPRTWSSPSSWLGTAWSPWYARRTSTCTIWTCTCSSTWWASSFHEGEGWTPICHPKFSTAGFFHTHISYLEPASDLCLILVSADREEFFNLSDCKHRFLERLSKRTAYKALKEALKCPSYSVSQVGIPELRHFLYKSKTSGIYTTPELPLAAVNKLLEWIKREDDCLCPQSPDILSPQLT